MNHHENTLPDCLSGAPYTPEACERGIVRERNMAAPKCSAGHATNYSHAVGAFRCEFGALVKGNGREVTSCGGRS